MVGGRLGSMGTLTDDQNVRSSDSILWMSAQKVLGLRVLIFLRFCFNLRQRRMSVKVMDAGGLLTSWSLWALGFVVF